MKEESKECRFVVSTGGNARVKCGAVLCPPPLVLVGLIHHTKEIADQGK